MRKIGETLAGMILVEMPIEEWAIVTYETDPRIENPENSLEWHIRRAMEEGRLTIRVGHALLRGTCGHRFNGEYYSGLLEGKSLSEFLTLIQEDSVLSVSGIGKKSVKEIRKAFLGF